MNDSIYMYYRDDECYVTSNYDLAVQRTTTGSILVLNNTSEVSNDE